MTKDMDAIKTKKHDMDLEMDTTKIDDERCPKVVINQEKEAEMIAEKHSIVHESPIKPDNYKSLGEYVNENIAYLNHHGNIALEENEYTKMAELILQTYKIGDVLNHNEYAVLAEYFEKQQNYSAVLAILGASLTNNLQSISNYGTLFSICALVNIAEMLMKTNHFYNANKILEFAYEWAEEKGFVDSEKYEELITSMKILQELLSQKEV